MSSSPLHDPMVRQLIAMYLGPIAAQADDQRPEMLLELPPGPHASGAVMAATQKQLAKVAARAPAGSVEAAQLRLVLQETAARLMMGAGDRERSSTPATPPQPSAASVASAPIPSPTVPQQAETARVRVPPRADDSLRKYTPVDPGFLADAERVVTRSGGVDATVLATLHRMAKVRGLPPSSVPAVLNALLKADMPSRTATRQGVQSGAGSVPDDAPESQSRGPVGSETGEDEPDPAVVFLKRAVLVGGIVFVVLVGVLAAGLIVISQTAAPPPDDDQAASAPPTKPPSGEKATTADARPETKPEVKPGPAKPKVVQAAEIEDGATADVIAVVRQIRRCAEMAAVSPEDAAGLFSRTLKVTGQAWPRMDPGQRTAAAEATVDYLYKLRGDADIAKGMEAIAALIRPLTGADRRITAGEVAPAAWAAGLLARLTRERDLPGGAAAVAERGVSALLGRDRSGLNARVESGALAALRLMPLRIVDRHPQTDAEVLALQKRGKPDTADAAAAFVSWEQCVRAAAGQATENDRKLAELVVLEGLERVMHDAREPDEDRAVMEAITSIGARLRWRDQDISRRRLLTWFDDPTISAADLQTLTAAIATKSSADNVDTSMVLTHGASGEQRTALRDAYALAWGLKQSFSLTGVGDQWTKIAREQIERTDARREQLLDEMRSAAILAKLNQVAWHRQRGETNAAAEVLTVTLPGLLPNGASGSLLVPNGLIATVSAPQVRGNIGGGGSDWAVRFLSDKLPLGRIERLKEAESFGANLGQVDADVIAEAAMASGSTSEVRNAAQRACTVLSGQATMVNGMLRVLPRAQRNQPVSGLIERVTGRALPGWQNERWPLEARRAVVERLLELIASDPSARPMDQMAAVLAEAYSNSLALPAGKATITEEDAGRVARDGAAEMFRRLRAAAEKYAPNPSAPIPIDRIDRSHAGRLALARGVAQQFSADQVGCAELLAYLVSAEQPARAAVAATVLKQLSAKRREATSVVEQIKCTEAAMLRLWMLRSGEDAP